MKYKTHPTKMINLHRIYLGTKVLFFGPKDKRQRVLNELVRVIAKLLASNYVGESYKSWIKDKYFSEKFRALSPHNFFSEERKFALKEFSRSLKHMEGAVAECGSYVGVSAWFIANELPEVDFYLFDSFEGLSKPGSKDKPPTGVYQWKEGDMQTTEEILRNNLAEFPNIHVMKGWIPNRFNYIESLQFRLVHIDVDLYQPTLDSLVFFYARMNSGGIIIMDDYGFENCPGASKAADDFMADKPEQIIHLPTGQGIIIRYYDT